MDIGEWLREAGLQSYEQAFKDNAVDIEILPRLTADDLRDIGVHAVGHRRKILEAIRLLNGEDTQPAPGSVERRQLTIMFVDLVGSVDLSRRLDPEELRDVMRSYQNAVAGEIARFEGHVAKFMGDGVLAYFGWPRATEDAAERAVRAGLSAAAAVGGMSAGEGIRLAARVGVATGVVIVGDLLGAGAAKEEVVTGETPNLAARLQQIAEPGAVVIAESTRRLVGDLFELAGLGALPLKGFATPAPAWRVLGEGKAESRFAALRGAHVVPLVGRGEELELMLSRWRLAERGAGQILLIFGEPGIGKSRLALALRAQLEAAPISVVNYACSPHHLNSPLFPFITQLEREAGFASGEAPKERLERLAALVSAEGLAEDAVPLLADLLRIRTEAVSSRPDMSPQQRRSLLFKLFLARLDRLAARAPVLMVLEDAHWLDPTSRELFDPIVERAQRLPVLLVATFRREVPPPWIGFPHVTLLTLSRLPQPQAAALVSRITGGKALPEDVLSQILARTDGVPLFVEELTKAVLESGMLRDAGDRYLLARPLQSFAIPATLQDSLMARLDRLAPVKEVAQIGACIGREFDRELLASVVSTPASELDAALDRLVAAELVFRRGPPAAATYVFKHALVCDAAYESLLKRRRQELHERIAAALEDRFPQLVEAQPELAAHHLSEAGLAERALPHWLQAGRLAVARSANNEAVAHLRSGLDCIGALARGPSRARMELSLQLALGFPLVATRGFASRDAETAYQRAQELGRELGSDEDLFAALRGLGYVYHVRADFRRIENLVEEAAAVAKRSADPVLSLEAKHFAAMISFHFGEFRSCRERLLELIGGGYRGAYHAEIYEIDVGVFCRAYVGHCDWHLGHVGDDLKVAEEGLLLAREVSHPFSIALALNYKGMLHQFRREPDAALEAATEAGDVCAEYGFDYYGAWSSLVRAWAIAESRSDRRRPDRLQRGARGVPAHRRPRPDHPPSGTARIAPRQSRTSLGRAAADRGGDRHRERDERKLVRRRASSGARIAAAARSRSGGRGSSRLGIQDRHRNRDGSGREDARASRQRRPCKAPGVARQAPGGAGYSDARLRLVRRGLGNAGSP